MGHEVYPCVRGFCLRAELRLKRTAVISPEVVVLKGRLGLGLVISFEESLLRYKGLSSGFLSDTALVKIVVLWLLRFSFIELPNDRVLAFPRFASRALDLALRRLVEKRFLLEESQQVVLVTH